jgi:hypothetical protein
MIREFDNLEDFEQAFPDEKSAIDRFRSIRWPAGICCPDCGSMKVYDLKMGKHKCGEKECAAKFTVRNRTIFDDSKLPLRKWFKAIFLMTSHKKGISSCQLARDVGVTQKTAWFMLHRIRNASMTQEFKAPLTGTIEADEMYVGGQAKWKHANKRVNSGLKGKAARDKRGVLGMMQRGGELRLTTLKGATGSDFRSILINNIERGSRVHTDEAPHYVWMQSLYAHSLVKHSLNEYVRGDVTTNSIEGAFGHFKRAVTGVYHKISDEHLDRYLQCFSWRWNRRKMGEGERVNELLKATKGKRITYKQLIRKDECEKSQSD